MPVPSLITDISTTAASNSPVGSDPIGGTLDDYLRNIQAIVKKQFVKGTDLASAATLPVPVEGAYFVVTGTTTITAFANCYDGRTVTLYFPAGITLTHSSALVLPGAANIVTQAGDCGTFVNDGTNIWRCVNYSNGAPGLLNGRNRLINGNFDIWQRGTSFNITTAGAYTADRCLVGISSGTATFSRNTHTVANAAYGTYYATFALASNGNASVGQRIENVRTLAGQTVTFSFYANVSTGSAQIVSAGVQQYFGTGGAPSATTNTFTNVTVNNSGFARYTVTISVPSLSGKTIGTNGDDCLIVIIYLPNGTYTIDTFGWQVEAGGVATPFEFRPIGQELALCQRYYTPIPPAIIGSVVSISTVSYFFTHPVTMRVSPTLLTTSAGTTILTVGSANTSSGTITSSYLRPGITYFVVNGYTGLSTGLSGVMDANSTASYALSAEL